MLLDRPDRHEHDRTAAVELRPASRTEIAGA
jgi:hypothetical protein